MSYEKCEKCGKELAYHEHRYGGLCQTCYVYYRKGGTDNPLPPKGRIEHDHRGYVICHICGRAYKRLGSHTKEIHKMSINTYKEMFGLCNNSRTTEINYSNTMRSYAYINHMDEQLRQVGMNTRIKKGETDKRKGKQIRLQEHLNKMNRTEGK